jgi:MSHA pilin protein MshC
MYRLKGSKGFTLLEIILVMAIIVIVSTIIIARARDLSTGLISQTDLMKTHIRYAQTLAMSAGGSDVYGIKCSANKYWLFHTDPDINANIMKLTDDASYMDADDKLVLAEKNIQAINFTILFDDRGIPYSSYTDETNNTPLSTDLNITVSTVGGGATQTITITELTGFIP